MAVVATVGHAEALFTPEDFQSLGVTEDVRRTTLRDAVIIQSDAADAPANDPGPDEGPTPALIVVNDTPRSRQFIARARAADPSRSIWLVTGERANSVLHKDLTVAEARTPAEAAERVLIKDEDLLPSGSRVFVFLREGEDHATEGWTLNFLQALEQLQSRIALSGNGSGLASHEDLYMVVESRVHGEHGYEFVHDQLYVDSVFDPSTGERSVFAAMAQMIAQFGLPEAPEPAAAKLQAFAVSASSLANVESRRVTDSSLFGDGESPRLVGLRVGDAAQLIVERSFPPRRLLSVLRPKDALSTMRLEPVATGPEDLADVELTEHDLLILLPSL